MNMPDSVLATIRAGIAAGADKKTLSQVALKTGSDAYKAGNASKSRTDLLRAVQFLKLADELEPSADAKFLAGASAFLVGQSAVNEAQDTKSCTLARLAKENFGIAQDNVPAGLQSYADAAKQLLTATRSSPRPWTIRSGASASDSWGTGRVGQRLSRAGARG